MSHETGVLERMLIFTLVPVLAWPLLLLEKSSDLLGLEIGSNHGLFGAGFDVGLRYCHSICG